MLPSDIQHAAAVAGRLFWFGLGICAQYLFQVLT